MLSDESTPRISDTPSVNAACWNPTRKELLAWLYRNAPSLAELYEGAVLLIFDIKLPGRIRFITHAVREIRNRLPDVIAGSQENSRLDYKGRVDDLVKIWEDSGFSLDGSMPISNISVEIDILPNPDINIPRGVFLEISRFLYDHEMARSKPQDAAIRLFEALAPENKNIREALHPIISQWLKVTGWFVERAHDSGKTDGMYDLQELETQFELFETYLGALVRTFFNTIEELDEILEDANT